VLGVRLLGRLEVVDLSPARPARAIAAPAGRRAWSLLAWLALHPGAHPRGLVAARFWPDVMDSSARASLRTAVWGLRRGLGLGAGDALLTGRDELELRCETDLVAFDRHVARDELAEAVALCRGPLLADFDEDWVLEARDAHAERLGATFLRLAERAATASEGVHWARRRVALVPLDEAAVRDLMRRLADAGDVAGALTACGRLRERLRTSLGLVPSPETRALCQALRAARLGEQHEAASRTAPRLAAVVTVPSPMAEPRVRG